MQEKLDHTKAHYQTLLNETQELQQKLNDGQKTLKQISEERMQAVNKDPKPEELETNMEVDPLPAALESFVGNLGVSLSAEQKSQLHGLLKRPSSGTADLSKRRKTDGLGLDIPVPLDDFDWGHDFDHAHFTARASDVFIHDGSQQRARFDIHGVAGDMQPTGDLSSSSTQGLFVAEGMSNMMRLISRTTRTPVPMLTFATSARLLRNMVAGLA